MSNSEKSIIDDAMKVYRGLHSKSFMTRVFARARFETFKEESLANNWIYQVWNGLHTEDFPYEGLFSGLI